MAKVKICGISHEAEINIMNELKPDYIGFALYYKIMTAVASMLLLTLFGLDRFI